MNLSDILNSINFSKEPLFESDRDAKVYAPFVVNRCLSYFPDTIFDANLMNQHSHLDPIIQFEYFRNAVRKKKRFSRWFKEESSPEVDVVMEYYSMNRKRAKEILNMDILSQEDLEEMKKEMFKGG